MAFAKIVLIIRHVLIFSRINKFCNVSSKKEVTTNVPENYVGNTQINIKLVIIIIAFRFSEVFIICSSLSSHSYDFKT